MDFAYIFNIRSILKQALNDFKSLKYYKYYISFIEYCKKLKKEFKELSDLKFASFSYIPLAGWILPLVFRNTNSHCKYHAKQGFILSFIVAITVIALNLINIFTPREFREFRLWIVIAIYLLYLCYLIFSIIAINLILKGKDFKIFFIRKIADYIEL